MSSQFQIQGLDAALAKLRGLRRDIGEKALKAAGTRAMRIVRDAARAVAKPLDDPKSPSNIAKNIVTRVDNKAGKREGGVVVKVGIMGGARPAKGREDTGHWRMLEFGTSKMRAQPFMRQALESNIDAVTAKLVAELEPAIDKAIAKAAKS